MSKAKQRTNEAEDKCLRLDCTKKKKRATQRSQGALDYNKLSPRCNYVNKQRLSRPRASPAVVTREGLFRGDSTCHFPALAVKHSEDLHSEDSIQRQHPINEEKKTGWRGGGDKRNQSLTRLLWAACSSAQIKKEKEGEEEEEKDASGAFLSAIN